MLLLIGYWRRLLATHSAAFKSVLQDVKLQLLSAYHATGMM